MITITMDDSDVKVKSYQAKLLIERLSVKGMEEIMKAFMHDSIHTVPKVPRDKGSLAGSHSIFVNGKFIADSKSDVGSVKDGYDPTPSKSCPILVSEGSVTGVLVANKPYAASLHEGISRFGRPYVFKDPGSGSHWILATMLGYGEEYLLKFAGAFI